MDMTVIIVRNAQRHSYVYEHKTWQIVKCRVRRQWHTHTKSDIQYYNLKMQDLDYIIIDFFH